MGDFSCTKVEPPAGDGSIIPVYRLPEQPVKLLATLAVKLAAYAAIEIIACGNIEIAVTVRRQY
ncbi:MAG: hypothetical protein IJ943_04630 [Akkermansia sp.]|nr:hypothetical protein [Akkermansia sp.]